MILINVKKDMDLRVVQWRPVLSNDQTVPVLFDVETSRIIGVPFPKNYPSPYTPDGGEDVLKEFLGTDEGFVVGTYLYGFPANKICDDIYVLDEYTIKPARTLNCCCCAGVFRGRQWPNQDISFGLGSCCSDRCRPKFTEEEFIKTYGIYGFNFNILE